MLIRNWLFGVKSEKCEKNKCIENKENMPKAPGADFEKAAPPAQAPFLAIVETIEGARLSVRSREHFRDGPSWIIVRDSDRWLAFPWSQVRRVEIHDQ